MTLACDIKSLFHPAGKEVIYGRRGENVTLVADHMTVLIVEGKNGRFPVTKVKIVEYAVSH